MPKFVRTGEVSEDAEELKEQPKVDTDSGERKTLYEQIQESKGVYYFCYCNIRLL